MCMIFKDHETFGDNPQRSQNGVHINIANIPCAYAAMNFDYDYLNWHLNVFLRFFFPLVDGGNDKFLNLTIKSIYPHKFNR